MNCKELLDSLERVPVIAAVKDNGFDSALNSPTEVIFYLKANILTVAQRVKAAKEKGKTAHIHWTKIIRCNRKNRCLRF